MFAPCDFVVASVGGRGGAGTLQEILGAFIIAQYNKKEMICERGIKPLVIDNRLEVWEGLHAALAPFNIEQGRGMLFVSGTDEVVEAVERYQSGEDIVKDWR